MQNFIIVPFNAESEHGITTVEGIAKISRAGVILEFESKIVGLVSKGVKEVRLPANDILDVEFRKGFMKRFASIVIRMKSLGSLGDMPNTGGMIKLKLKRADFERGRDAVMRLSGQDVADIAFPDQEPDHPQLSPVNRVIAERQDDVDTRLLDDKK